MNENDDALLRDMLDFALRIELRLAGKQRADLEADMEALGGTIVRELAVIGEAANHLSTDFTNSHNQLNIAQIIAMRNRLVHGYRDINWDVVWRTCQQNIPELIRQLRGILSE